MTAHRTRLSTTLPWIAALWLASACMADPSTDPIDPIDPNDPTDPTDPPPAPPGGVALVAHAAYHVRPDPSFPLASGAIRVGVDLVLANDAEAPPAATTPGFFLLETDRGVAYAGVPTTGVPDGCPAAGFVSPGRDIRCVMPFDIPSSEVPTRLSYQSAAGWVSTPVPALGASSEERTVAACELLIDALTGSTRETCRSCLLGEVSDFAGPSACDGQLPEDEYELTARLARCDISDLDEACTRELADAFDQVAASCDAACGFTDSPMGMQPPAPAARVGVGTDRAALSPANFACLGTVWTPPGSADGSFAVRVIDLSTSAPVAGAALQVAPGNAFGADGGCVGTCQSLFTDAAGVAVAHDTLDSWFAYRLGPDPARGYVEVLGYNWYAQSGGVDIAALRLAHLHVFDALRGEAHSAGSTYLGGTLFDCDGEPLVNARVRVFDARDGVELRAAVPYDLYEDDEGVPSVDEVSSNVGGGYWLAGVSTPASREVRVESWGVLREGGPEERLGCERVRVAPDGVTIVNVGPRRQDGC